MDPSQVGVQSLHLATFVRLYRIPHREVYRLRRLQIVEIQQGGYRGHSLMHEKLVVFDPKKLNEYLDRKHEVQEVSKGHFYLPIPDPEKPYKLPTTAQSLSGEGLFCPKCGRKAFYAIIHTIEGKSGKIYSYWKYYHYDRRKTSRRRYCYEKVYSGPLQS